MQQGGTPSPFDRNIATKMASKAYAWMVEKVLECQDDNGRVHTNKKDTACLLGMRTRHYKVSFILQTNTDEVNCMYLVGS